MIRRLANAVRQLFFMTLGWLFVVPVARSVPKKSGLVLFVGQKDGRFADNTKYLYLYAHVHASGGVEPCFAMNSRKYAREFEQLKQQGYRVISIHSLQGTWTMLRARLVIFDHESWTNTWQLFLFAGATKVQLWHGSGIKQIRRMRGRRKRSFLRKTYDLLTAPLVRYDCVLMNSEKQREDRGSAFLTRSFFVGVHPRVDALFQLLGPGAQIGADAAVLATVEQYKERGSKVVLYAPTFRKRLPAAESVIDYNAIARWADEHDVVWVQKSHPNSSARLESEHPRLIEYERLADVYPLLKYVDLLVTDYSSIYTDFLLMDRSICFFTYDLQKYLEHERTLLLDYDGMIPGPRVDDLEELLRTIGDVLSEVKPDAFQPARAVARAAHFVPYQGEATAHLWRVVEERYVGIRPSRRRRPASS